MIAIGGRPVWIDDAGYNAPQHLREPGCPTPGDEQEPLTFLATVVTAPLPFTSPLRTATLVTGLANGGTAQVFVRHHVLVGRYRRAGRSRPARRRGTCRRAQAVRRVTGETALQHPIRCPRHPGRCSRPTRGANGRVAVQARLDGPWPAHIVVRGRRLARPRPQRRARGVGGRVRQTSRSTSSRCPTPGR